MFVRNAEKGRRPPATEGACLRERESGAGGVQCASVHLCVCMSVWAQIQGGNQPGGLQPDLGGRITESNEQPPPAVAPPPAHILVKVSI